MFLTGWDSGGGGGAVELKHMISFILLVLIPGSDPFTTSTALLLIRHSAGLCFPLPVLQRTRPFLRLCCFAPVCIPGYCTSTFYKMKTLTSKSIRTSLTALMVQSYIKSPGNGPASREQMFLLNRGVTWFGLAINPLVAIVERNPMIILLGFFREQRFWVFLCVWDGARKGSLRSGTTHMWQLLYLNTPRLSPFSPVVPHWDSEMVSPSSWS